MRRKIILFAIALLFASGDALAQQSCTLSTGYTVWTAVGSVTGTAWGGTCTPTADDNFTIQGGEVVVNGTVTVTTGSVSCTSGTLRIAAGSTLAPGTRLTISGSCKFDAQGEKIWSGRVASDLTYAAGPPSTLAFTVQGSSPTAATGAATTDYLVFGDDDPESDTAPITQPVQSDPANPNAGYYRPAYASRSWWDINAVSSTAITFNANAYTDIESLPGGGVDPYGGTRGPGLTTATALSANVRTRYGHLTKLQVDLNSGGPAGAGPIDGDLSGQYVVFQAGVCAGKRYKIKLVDSNVSPTVDDIYVQGDASGCGTGNIKIDFGMRPGDPVYIIRPATINGTNTARIDITGGTTSVRYARLINLFPGIPTGVLNPCNVCFYRASAGGAEPTGYMRDVDFAFPGVAASGAATAAVGIMNQNATDTAYKIAGETFDMSGFTFDRLYIHDQRLNSAGGSCPGTCEGVHGFFDASATGVTIKRPLIQRIGDDGIFGTIKSYGANDPNWLTVRHPVINEIFTTAGSNSSQCIDFQGGGTSTTDFLYTRLTVTDANLTGCKDGIFVGFGRNVSVNRASMGGYGTLLNGAISNYNSGSIPVDFLRTYPNTYRNVVGYQLNPAAVLAANGLIASGSIKDSIIAGNLIGGGGGVLQDVVDVHRSIIDLNDHTSSTRYPIARSSGAAGSPYSVSTQTFEDAVFLNEDANMSMLGPTYNTSPYTAISLLRVYFGVGAISADGFFYNTSGDNGSVSGRDITVAATTPAAYGARGLGVIGAGANISYACIETTLANAITGGLQYGSSRTATSIELPMIGPDASVDASIEALTKPDARCERPRSLGIAQVGPEQLRDGDGFIDSIANYTTHESLIRQLGGGSCAGGVYPCEVYP